MFTPIFHGQNRIKNQIIPPDAIPDYSNYTIWINSDSANISKYPYDGYNLVTYYTNIADRSKDFYATLEDANRPKLIEPDPNFNNINTSYFNGIYGVPGIRFGADAPPARITTPLLNDISGFIALSYNSTSIYNYLAAYQYITIYNWLDSDGTTWAITLTGSYIQIRKGGQSGMTLISSVSHKNSGLNKIILSFTSRKIYIDNVEVLDISDIHPINTNTMVRNTNIGISLLNNRNLPDSAPPQSIYLAEAIIYGFRLTQSQSDGIIQWLKNKYNM